MNSSRLLVFILLLSTLSACTHLTPASQAPSTRTFYLATTGDDLASGLSPTTPWKSLDRANRQPFQPGDALLLRAGDTFHGQLHPQGSGTSDRPIRLSHFGEGPPPIINLGEAAGAAVKLTNQHHWIIENLEITSGAPPQPGLGRQGIVLAAEGPAGHTSHITVRNNFIHDLWGQLGGPGTATGYNSSAIFAGPPQGPRPPAGQVPARADNLTIERNRIARVDRCGIIIWKGIDHIVVRHNIMENLGGDGIFLNGCQEGLIERNVVSRSCLRTGDPTLQIPRPYNPHSAAIWIQDAAKTRIQFNEVYDTGRQPGNGDGNAYDFDFNCTDCIVQYNYSRNNHGFLLIMGRTRNNIARFNISQNDQTHLVQTHGPLADGNLIHNNVFYIDYGIADIDLYMGGAEVPDDAKRLLGARFVNNLFYATGQGRFRTVYTHGSALDRKFMENVKVAEPGALFRRNWYFGPWTNGLPDDPESQTGDPRLRAPGTGGYSLETLTGYQFLPNSPARHTATPLPTRGPRDFFNNPLHPTRASFGVHEPATFP